MIEVIVIDNPDTTDQTREIVASYENVKLLIIGPERSSQRNLGADNAIGNCLLFLDADMVMTEELLTETLAIIKQAGANYKAWIIKERVPGSSLHCRARNLEKTLYDNNLLICAPRLMSKQVFQRAGGYQTSMIAGEDWNLRDKLIQNQVQINFLKSFLSHHEENLGFFGSIGKKVYYAQKLENYNPGLSIEINPIYRFGVLLSQSKLILRYPIVWFYLILLKSCEFMAGFVVYFWIRINKS